MKKAVQRDFFEGKRENGPRRTKHGGGLETNKRKLARPFRASRPLHIVLKSSHARGALSMRSMRNRLAVDKIVVAHATKARAKLHAKQNVGNHIHLLMTFKTRVALKVFLRSVAALIARHVTGAKKGKPFGSPFWDEIPFTRIFEGLRDFRGMLNYIFKNKIEAESGTAARERMERREEAERKLRRRRRSARRSSRGSTLPALPP